jgi:hypothetical protein
MKKKPKMPRIGVTLGTDVTGEGSLESVEPDVRHCECNQRKEHKQR